MTGIYKNLLIIISFSATLVYAESKTPTNVYEKILSITNNKLKEEKSYVSILKEINPSKSLELENFIQTNYKGKKPLEKVLMSYNQKYQKPQFDIKGIQVFVNEYDTNTHTLILEIEKKPFTFSINDSLENTLLRLNNLLKIKSETSSFKLLDLFISPAFSDPISVAVLVGTVAILALETYMIYDLLLNDIYIKTEFMKMRFEKFKPKILEINSECRKIEYAGKPLEASELKKLSFAKEQLVDIKNEFSEYFVKFSSYHWDPVLNSAMECVESLISSKNPNVIDQTRTFKPRIDSRSGELLPPVRKLNTKDK